MHALTREILFLPLEHKIHIFSPPCNILYIRTTKSMNQFFYNIATTTWALKANCSKYQNKVLKRCIFKSSLVLGFAKYWGLCKKKSSTSGEIQELGNAQFARSPSLGEADDKCINLVCTPACYFGLSFMTFHSPPVRATTRTGYIVTSSNFAKWRPHSGTRYVDIFQLFSGP